MYPSQGFKSGRSLVAGQPAIQQYQQQHLRYHHHQQEKERDSEVEPLLVTEAPAIPSSFNTWSALVSATSMTSQPMSPSDTILALDQKTAQVTNHSSGCMEGSRVMNLEGDGMESLPIDPPPPYDKARTVECPESNSSSLCDNHSKPHYHQLNYWRYLCLNSIASGLGACGWILSLRLWEQRPWVQTWDLNTIWSLLELTSLYCMVSVGIVAAYVIMIYAILSRLFEFLSSKTDSVVDEGGMTGFVVANEPESDVNGSECSGAVAITKSSTVTRKREDEDGTKRLEVDVGTQVEPCTQITHTEPQSNTAEVHFENISRQRKANRTTKRRDNSVMVRRRKSPSSSFSTPVSSSMISASIQQVKSELKIWAISLFVLSPTIVPRPMSWGPSEKRSRNKSHGFPDRNIDSSISQKVSVSGSLGSSQKENLEPYSTGTIARTSSSYASESSIMRLAKVALDPERLGSIIQFYKQKHVTESMARSDSMRQGQDEFTFVVRSSRLPTVRVGLYGATQKRLWTSTGSIDLANVNPIDEITDE
ncbi:hypothetical protein BGX21_011459 [Mortierella sp. AD011]|nr:hypothetical protein BGX21_011459 [Mortierella sp. AD011]